MKKGLFEENLKEIIVVKSDTKEVLGVIPNQYHEGEIVQSKDIDFIFNYSDESKKYISRKGKVFLKD